MTRFGVLVRAAVLAVAIGLVPQGIWSALLLLNLRVSRTLPWAVPLMVALLWTFAQYLNGRWPPASTSVTRHRLLRANRVPSRLLLWTWFAGMAAVLALTGFWIVLASFARMPGSVLPDLSSYPWWTAWLAVVMGAAISPFCEQAAFFGYWQVTLEREVGPASAIIGAALTFALLPHPPAAAALWIKLPFFFLTGLTFSLMAYYARSILPGLALHFVALFTFFVLIWPADRTRPLVLEGGHTAWFWMHVAQVIGCSALTVWGFRRSSQVAGSVDRAVPLREQAVLNSSDTARASSRMPLK